MSTLNKPDSDQASDGEMSAVMSDVLRRFIRDEVDGMLPAEIVAYDDSSNRATVKPLVMIGTTSGGKVSRGQISNVPVWRFGGGGFFMRYPLKAGDKGWIVANDRDISLVMQAKGGEDWPNTKRLHSFSDCIFLPDTFKDWAIAGADTENAVLQSIDGQVVVSLANDAIELRVGSQVVRLDALGLTHNGVNIGSTHTHVGPQTAPPGPISPTGVPNP